jgi:hypothetical protein
MKHSIFTIIAIIGLVVPGLTYAANASDNGSAAYQRDLASWNDASQAVNAARLAAQKLHFEYNNIYEHDLAAGNDVLTGKINQPVASAERVAGVEIASATDYEAQPFDVDSYGAEQTAFWWNSEPVTAFA